MIYELESMNEIDVYKVNTSVVTSYLFFHKNKYYQNIVAKMLDETRGKWEEAVRWWISNTARSLKSNASGFTFSLHASSYSNNNQKIGYRQVKAFIDFLEQRGYINIYKGYVKTWKYEKGKAIPETTIPSCMIFRERTLAMWDGVNTNFNLWKEVEEDDLAVIRDRESKEYKNTRGVSGIKAIKEEVKMFNSSLKGADITFNGKPIADVVYRRIFSGDIDTGGRLYSVNGGVQLLPQKIRASSLMIDGEEVVELDYSSIHPNICYQMLLNNEGINVRDILGKDFSPYDADLSFIRVDGRLKKQWESLTGKEHNPVRQLAKLAILIGMNSSDANAAAWTIGNKVKEDRKQLDIKEQQFYALTDSIDYNRVLSAVQNHNDFIRDKFFSDAGIALQNIDSKIMMNIVGAMGEKGHTVLCYHDSALVKKSAEQDLHNAMLSAWKDVLLDTTFCKIDKK